MISAGDPIGQMIFHVLDEPTEQPYSGKYQDQPQCPIGPIDEKEDG
jgi:dCTP deaminase